MCFHNEFHFRYNYFFSSFYQTLFVLQGEFRIQSDKGGANIRAGCEVIIKEGSSYGISNETDDVGVIEITYASEH